MAMEPLDPFDDDNMRNMFGPQQVDQQVRQAIDFCWMSLPPERKNIDQVELEIRRLVDRAIQNMRDDADHFSTDGE